MTVTLAPNPTPPHPPTEGPVMTGKLLAFPTPDDQPTGEMSSRLDRYAEGYGTQPTATERALIGAYETATLTGQQMLDQISTVDYHTDASERGSETVKDRIRVERRALRWWDAELRDLRTNTHHGSAQPTQAAAAFVRDEAARLGMAREVLHRAALDYWLGPDEDES